MFAPALQIVVYGSNWNGEKWKPEEGIGSDSIIGMLNRWNDNAAFALTVIYWIAGEFYNKRYETCNVYVAWYVA